MTTSPPPPTGIIPVAFILSAIFVIPIGVVMAVSAYETTLEIILDIVRYTYLLTIPSFHSPPPYSRYLPSILLYH